MQSQLVFFVVLENEFLKADLKKKVPEECDDGQSVHFVFRLSCGERIEGEFCRRSSVKVYI